MFKDGQGLRVKHGNSKQFIELARTARTLGQTAAARNDAITEAFLKGIAEGLILADLMNTNQAQLISRWSQILVAQNAVDGTIRTSTPPGGSD